jgi:DinB superfamily
LRHLLFATDVWVRRGVLGEEAPFDRLDLPPDDYRPADTAALGIDLAARPTFDEVLTLRAGRLAVVRDVIAGLDDAILDHVAVLAPDPAFPDEHPIVRTCLRVLVNEERAHLGYATRDLAVLERR